VTFKTFQSFKPFNPFWEGKDGLKILTQLMQVHFGGELWPMVWFAYIVRVALSKYRLAVVAEANNVVDGPWLFDPYRSRHDPLLSQVSLSLQLMGHSPNECSCRLHTTSFQ
jgi:hypothetical protein